MDTEILKKEYGISDSKLKSVNITWDELSKIFDDYEKIQDELKNIGIHINNVLLCCKKVHSIRMRIKNPYHIIEKIIRKRSECSERIINFSNYKDEITDIIGLRALHLFKADWLDIHNYLKDKWDFIDNPIAYIRQGDDKKINELYNQNECEVKDHKYGYRSVHYLIKPEYTKDIKVICEIQVRTIFEEGWSEIDHQLRYPYEINNKTLEEILAILNRLSGNADEMATFIRSYLKIFNDEKNEKTKLIKTIDDLQKKVNTLKVNSNDKSYLSENLGILSTQFKMQSDIDTRFLASIEKKNPSIFSSSIDNYFTLSNQKKCSRCGRTYINEGIMSYDFGLCENCRAISSTGALGKQCKIY